MKATQKEFRYLSVEPGIRGKKRPPRRKKNGELSIFFQSREQVVARRGQIRKIGWVIKTLEAQVGQFLLGCKCPVSRGIFVNLYDFMTR